MSLTNQEMLINLIAELINSNQDKFFAIGGDVIRFTNKGYALEVLFDNGDSDCVIQVTSNVVR